MGRRLKMGANGAPAWIVTFADLMSLLSCFFILIISFSIQDVERLNVVAGSMRDAFGVAEESRRAGIIEIDGNPHRKFLKKDSMEPMEEDSNFEQERHDSWTKQGPDALTHRQQIANIKTSRHFATAAASLRQAWQEMPDILEISDQIMLQETEEGLDIQIIDQEGRAMFAEGSRYPVERTRQLLAAMAPKLAAMPNRIVVTGHTSATPETDAAGAAWDLSGERAMTVRSILASHGVPNDQFAFVGGKGDSDPLFPENPFMAGNRRISILLKFEEPPVPPGLRP